MLGQSRLVITSEQLASIDSVTAEQLKRTNWIVPFGDQSIYLADFKRHLIELASESESESYRHECSGDEVEKAFEQACQKNRMNDDEITALKCSCSQCLVLFITCLLVDLLEKNAIFLAPNNQVPKSTASTSVQNACVLVTKIQRAGQDIVVAQVAYWGINFCYDDSSAFLMPGQVTAEYVLTNDGFALRQIDVSNSLLKRLISGEKIEGDMRDNVCRAVEEEYTSAACDVVHVKEACEADFLLVAYLDKVLAAAQIIRDGLVIIDDRSARSLDALNTQMNAMVVVVRSPGHAPAIHRLKHVLTVPIVGSAQQGRYALSRLQWVMLGVFSLVVMSACIAASLMSFGVLAMPSFMMTGFVLSAAFKVSAIGAGAALVSLDVAAGVHLRINQQAKAQFEGAQQTLACNLSAISTHQSALFSTEKISPKDSATETPSPRG
jgi:hypothetical protein